MTRWYILAAALSAGVLYGQTQVLTANYGNERTNATLTETVLTTANVNLTTFGKVGDYTVDGQVYAQPLYASGVSIGGQDGLNVVYVATMHNSVYAFDADSPSSSPLWQVSLGPSLPVSAIRFRVISPEIGILGTPVIDLGTNTLYAVAETFEQAPIFRLHALDLSDGSEKPGSPVVITATVNGNSADSNDGSITLDNTQHLQRPGLLLANHSIYIAFGSVHDRAPYHGWILAYDASTLNQTAVFNATPEGLAGGIWQAGRAPAADQDGNVYVVTGNGDYDGQVNFGESFVKLSPGLQVLDWFAPNNWQALSDVDYDLGSLGAVLIPGSNLVLGGDKANNLYLVPRDNMGHLGLGDVGGPQIFQPTLWGGLFNTAVWTRDPNPLVYLLEEGDWTGAFRLVDGTMEQQPFSQTPVTSDWAFQGMAISANGAADGTGILWLAAGDHTQFNVPGTLYAFDAMDLNNLLWTSDMKPERDTLGGFAKFATPTIANGRVYVPTFSNSVGIYGLLTTGTNGVRRQHLPLRSPSPRP